MNDEKQAKAEVTVLRTNGKEVPARTQGRGRVGREMAQARDADEAVPLQALPQPAPRNRPHLRLLFLEGGPAHRTPHQYVVLDHDPIRTVRNAMIGAVVGWGIVLGLAALVTWTLVGVL